MATKIEQFNYRLKQSLEAECLAVEIENGESPSTSLLFLDRPFGRMETFTITLGEGIDVASNQPSLYYRIHRYTPTGALDPDPEAQLALCKTEQVWTRTQELYAEMLAQADTWHWDETILTYASPEEFLHDLRTGDFQVGRRGVYVRS